MSGAWCRECGSRTPQHSDIVDKYAVARNGVDSVSQLLVDDADDVVMDIQWNDSDKVSSN